MYYDLEWSHRLYGDLDKCLEIMERFIDRATDDSDLIFQARLGSMKRDINVTDKESTTDEGRKKFLINIFNRFNRLSNNNELSIFARAEFRTFCFHVDRLHWANKDDLIRETILSD